ncbi:MAG: NAD(+)/NADH kinase [Acidimicrobiales bacterium]
MATVVLMVHPGRSDARALAGESAQWLRSMGQQALLGEGPLPEQGVDLIVSLGGDGTMLRAVGLALPLGVPVLGVNLGRLGYLTAVEPEGLQAALRQFLASEHEIEERMTLEARLEPADPRAPGEPARLGLNEVVLERAESGHTIRVDASIGGRPFLTYSCDGMIVATPTGSTAYNLSARGPVVSPLLEVTLLTPVSPHMLFDRTLVLGPHEEVRLELAEDKPANVLMDGVRLAVLEPGDAVVCRAGSVKARLVRPRVPDFHAIVRAKFGLSDR